MSMMIDKCSTCTHNVSIHTEPLSMQCLCHFMYVLVHVHMLTLQSVLLPHPVPSSDGPNLQLAIVASIVIAISFNS